MYQNINELLTKGQLYSFQMVEDAIVVIIPKRSSSLKLQMQWNEFQCETEEMQHFFRWYNSSYRYHRLLYERERERGGLLCKFTHIHRLQVKSSSLSLSPSIYQFVYEISILISVYGCLSFISLFLYVCAHVYTD